MADQNGAFIESRKLSLESGLPAHVLRIPFPGHVRVADLVVRTEISLEAFHELVVLMIMRAFPSALNEQNLLRHFGDSSTATYCRTWSRQRLSIHPKVGFWEDPTDSFWPTAAASPTQVRPRPCRAYREREKMGWKPQTCSARAQN